MLAGKPRGHWTAVLAARAFGHLEPARDYMVTKEFSDFDGVAHPVGERWTFLTSNFLPCEDGMSFFVATDEEQEHHIRLQWRAGQQADVLDHIKAYIRPA